MFTYICAACGISLRGHTDHYCQPVTSSTTFNLHQNCLDEKTLREQIAREIENTETPIVGDFKIANLRNVFDGIRVERTLAAAIARGSK